MKKKTIWDGPDPMAMILKQSEHIRCPGDKEQ